MKYQQNALSQFASQISFALANYQVPSFDVQEIHSLVFVGMGGSGIAGKIAASYFQNHLSLPIFTVSEYQLPSFVNQNSLVVICSYSGHTEEALSCAEQAHLRNSKIVCVASGGILANWAEQNNYTCFKAETGFQPRMALGYSLSYLLLLTDELFELNLGLQQVLSDLTLKLEKHTNYKEEARLLFEKYVLHLDKKIQIVADNESGAMAQRWQHQLNENSKKEAFIHPMPEMCHNVIETITNENSQDSFYVLFSSSQHPRIKQRYAFLEQLLLEKKFPFLVINFNSQELTTLIEKIYVLDWFSLWCADTLEVVSNEIPNIMALKQNLAGANS